MTRGRGHAASTDDTAAMSPGAPHDGPRIAESGRRRRDWVAALALLACAGVAGWWVVDARGGGAAGRQPVVDPLYAVVPGSVPVLAPVWHERVGRHRVRVPTKAVAYFPRGAQRPPQARQEEHVVQVLHFLPGETRRYVRESWPRPAVPLLRYSVEVRPVTVVPAGEDMVGISGVQPGELVSAHYLYSLGSDDVVSGDVAPTRALPLPPPQPAIPVAVELGPAAPTVRVLVPGPGWSAQLHPTDTGHSPRQLVAAAGGGSLFAQLDATWLTPRARAFLFQEQRAELNVGWITVRDAAGVVRADVAVRG